MSKLLAPAAFLLLLFILASSADARIFGRRRYRYYYYNNTTANWTVPANDTTPSEVPVAVIVKPDQVKPDQTTVKVKVKSSCANGSCRVRRGLFGRRR